MSSVILGLYFYTYMCPEISAIIANIIHNVFFIVDFKHFAKMSKFFFYTFQYKCITKVMPLFFPCFTLASLVSLLPCLLPCLLLVFSLPCPVLPLDSILMFTLHHGYYKMVSHGSNIKNVQYKNIVYLLQSIKIKEKCFTSCILNKIEYFLYYVQVAYKL